MPLRPLCVALVATLVAASTTAADSSCQPQQDRIIISHRTAEARLHVDGRSTPLEDGAERRVRVGRLPIEVTHTNTALYTFSASSEKVEAEELAAVRGFVAGLGPYFVEAARQMLAQAAPPTPLVAAELPDPMEEIRKAARSLSWDLEKLDQAILGEGGIRWLDLKLLTTLRTLAAPVHEAPVASRCSVVPEAVVELERAVTGHVIVARGEVEVNACGHEFAPLTSLTVEVLPRLERLYLDLLRHRGALQDALARLPREQPADASDPELLQRTDALLAAAATAQTDAATALDEARRVENTARLLLASRTAWCSPPLAVALSAGRRITVTIARRPEATIPGQQDPLTFTATLRPDWRVRPALGISLLASPPATYPEFGAVEEEAGGFRVTKSGRQDSRFTYGVTLGLTWRGLDWRDSLGIAMWFPEITVHPAEETPAFGVGLALSFWRFVKVGGGVLWTRHLDLDGQAVGDLLPSKDALRTREVYGRRCWYLSFSLIGWAPFRKD